MSAEAMAIALHHSRARGTARLVLIGVANHDGDGGSWPAISTLAIYAGVHPRNVQRALEQLLELRELVVIRSAGGTKSTPEYRRPNLYQFTLTCPPDCDRSKHHRTGRRRNSAPTGVAEAPGGAPVDNSPGTVDELSTGVALAPGVPVALAPPELDLGNEQIELPGRGTDRARLHEPCLSTPLHPCYFMPEGRYCERCGLSRDRRTRKDWVTGLVSDRIDA